MTRSRGQKKNRKNGTGDRRDGITYVKFHRLATTTLSGVTGTSTSSVSPDAGFFQGLNEVADSFDLFRFVKLRYRIHPMDPTDTTNQVMFYVPDVDVQTVTVAQAADSTISAVITPFCGVPSRWITVPRSQLKGMLDWYKCKADAGAAEFESQGLIYLVGGASEVINFELEGTCAFKNPVSSSLLMKRHIDRAEKLGLVKKITASNVEVAAKANLPILSPEEVEKLKKILASPTPTFLA